VVGVRAPKRMHSEQPLPRSTVFSGNFSSATSLY
jgi:hypothetical protein